MNPLDVYGRPVGAVLLASIVLLLLFQVLLPWAWEAWRARRPR